MTETIKPFWYCEPLRIAAVLVLVSVTVMGCGPSYPKCDDDGDCHEGEYCVNGMCQQCRGDSDCPSGHLCTGGRCEQAEDYCNSSADCEQDEECVANRCRMKSQSEATGPVSAANTQRECSLESVYFDFDSSNLSSSTRDQLVRNAECVKEKKVGSLHVTGYTDPRGTEEYNLALGDRRARAVEKYLKSLGVEASMDRSSLGEEMARGYNESTWAQDRRAELERKN